MWNELVEKLIKELLDPNKVFPEHRKDLRDDIKKVVEQFVQERIVQCYFKCDAETAKKAKGDEQE